MSSFGLRHASCICGGPQLKHLLLPFPAGGWSHDGDCWSTGLPHALFTRRERGGGDRRCHWGSQLNRIPSGWKSDARSECHHASCPWRLIPLPHTTITPFLNSRALLRDKGCFSFSAEALEFLWRHEGNVFETCQSLYYDELDCPATWYFACLGGSLLYCKRVAILNKNTNFFGAKFANRVKIGVL